MLFTKILLCQILIPNETENTEMFVYYSYMIVTMSCHNYNVDKNYAKLNYGLCFLFFNVLYN